MSKSSNNIAISVKHVSKNFVLPHEKNNSIKTAIVRTFKKKDKSADIQHALKDISFEVKEGEFFGILGRNGSGKSTLLKILAEIYKPTKGSVHTHGKLVPFIELGVGFNPELTGRENVYLNGALLGFSRKEIDARYDEIVEFAELKEFMDQKLKNYSSGMQVRLAFSVATRAEADILLVDEVLAVGDAAFQRKCFKYFKSLKKSGKTVIFVTHDMSAVREYCDRAILVNEGLVTHEGDASRVANEYLKLFTENTSKSDENRWGSNLARIEAIDVVVGSEIIFKADIFCSETVNDIIMGIRFRNSEGRVIAALNTGSHLFNFLKKGENKVAFSTPNVFGNGVFTVDATLRRKEEGSVCDNVDGIANFTNERSDVSNSESVVPPIITWEVTNE